MESLASEFETLSLPQRDEVGRVVKHEDGEEFLTYTVPDIRSNTRIVAICGIPDRNDWASPERDGWFLSDFFLFNYLLRGLGSRQTWLLSGSPQDLVKKYQEYLHGNPYHDRRVVLDQDMLDKNLLSPVTQIKEDGMVETFLKCLKSEAGLAKEKGESLLIILFGHGTDGAIKHGIWFGDVVTDMNNLMEINQLQYKSHILAMDDVAKVLPSGLDVAVFTNACYSGGWAVNRNLNYTVATAAGPEIQSESWQQSMSIAKRNCGSIWMSAIAETLIKEAQNPAESSFAQGVQMDESVQQKTYAVFAECCYNVLLNDVDRLGDAHEISFSAQNDDWSKAWTARTGMPIGEFKARWEALKVYSNPSVDPNQYGNRNPHVRVGENQAQIAKWLLEDDKKQDLPDVGLRGRFGSLQIESARSHVKHLAVAYQLSHPGRPSLANNVALHSDLGKVFSSPIVDWELLDRVQNTIRYRLNVMKYATLLLTATGTPKPQGKTCEGWEEDEWRHTYVPSNRKNWVSQLAQRMHKCALFPPPVMSKQGWFFGKPNAYIVAGMYELTRKCTGPNEAKPLVDDKAKLMEAYKTTVTGYQKEKVERAESVRSTKRRLQTAMGKLQKGMRSMSPTKRIRISTEGEQPKGKRI